VPRVVRKSAVHVYCGYSTKMLAMIQQTAK